MDSLGTLNIPESSMDAWLLTAPPVRVSVDTGYSMPGFLPPSLDTLNIPGSSMDTLTGGGGGGGVGSQTSMDDPGIHG